MIENLKARFEARRYDIWTDRIDPKGKGTPFIGYWYANGKLYYGHPLFIFFLSSQNDWFKRKYPNGIR